MIGIITSTFGFKMFSGSDECTIKLGLAAKVSTVMVMIPHCDLDLEESNP